MRAEMMMLIIIDDYNDTDYDDTDDDVTM